MPKEFPIIYLYKMKFYNDHLLLMRIYTLYLVAIVMLLYMCRVYVCISEQNEQKRDSKSIGSIPVSRSQGFSD